ncbi:hypothetical protein G6F61_010546 [Rhizopus arrhizus]|nr:hypothetical protein G6F61_010546 [Rhizopus arrhizus]
MPKILPQRHYGYQTASNTLKRKRITSSSQKLWSRFNKQGEAFELFKRLQIEERAQSDENLHGSDLSLGISEYLDGTLIQEQINKELIPELKEWKIDTFQIVNNIYKYSEDTRVQAKFNNEEDKHIFEGAVGQAAKLATFEFGQAKF